MLTLHFHIGNPIIGAVISNGSIEPSLTVTLILEMSLQTQQKSGLQGEFRNNSATL